MEGKQKRKKGEKLTSQEKQSSKGKQGIGAQELGDPDKSEGALRQNIAAG